MIKVRIQVEDQDGKMIQVQDRIREDAGALEVLASTALTLWRVASMPE